MGRLAGVTASARLRVLLTAGAAAVLLVALSTGEQVSASTPGSASTSGATSGLCGDPATPHPPIQHVIVVMLENHSYHQVVGSPAAPYQTGLAENCGSATAMFGATHTSAANYLATSAGSYPQSSLRGCASVSACTDASDNLYRQLDASGRTWLSYEEAMPKACSGATSGKYKIGHNPAIFYSDIPHAECLARDLPVASLTAPSGAFWEDLENQTLPSFSWVTPSKANDGEGSSNTTTALNEADRWLAGFMTLVAQSPSYEAGNTLVLVTYDEGFGSDRRTGENCTDAARDMPVTNGISAHQDSCHVPLFVIYPYTAAGASDGTFFDLYSVTRTVEDLFELPYLAHAADAQTASIVGHFGIE